MRLEFTDGVLYIFNDGENIPWLAQPTWPNNTPWADEAEARAWGQTAIEVALELTPPSELKDGPDGR